MADFDSSDIEFDVPENNASRIGSRAMASMTERSALDRIESKRTIKTLQDVAGAPGTIITRRYWYTLFMHFARVTLNLDSRPNKTPTPQDFVRFIARIPSHLQSRHSDGKIGYSVIQNAHTALERSLAFHYADWKLSRHDVLRIGATIQQLLNDGLITKDPVREKQWLTCQVVKKLVTAVLMDAIQNGTKCWDMTVAGCFSLVLQAALCSRAGDFMRSKHYTGGEYLKWEDIQLVATVDNGEVSLKMLVKLLWRKGHKQDPGNAMSVELHQLHDSLSVVDPVKLCVAYALRIGLVTETSWSALMDNVLNRPSKRFIWTKPSSPVFFALTRSCHLDFEKPSSIDQQRRFLCHAAKLVGMLKAPVTHDLRRGAAADVYALKSYAGSTDRVRRALGHSVESMNKGVTDDYIGRTKGDLWAERLNSNADRDFFGVDMASATFEKRKTPTAKIDQYLESGHTKGDLWAERLTSGAEPDSFGVEMASASFKKRKIATADIDQYCERNGLDKADRNDRYLARKNLAEQQRDQWSTNEQLIADTVQSPTSSNESPVVGEKTTSNDMGSDEDDDDQGLSPASTDTASRGLVMENLAPGLRGLTECMLDTQADGVDSNADDDSIELMTDGCIALLNATQDFDEESILTAEPKEFIGYLSSINLISVASDALPSELPSGNSRDPPARFLHRCTKERCTRAFNSALRRDQHQVNCVPPPPPPPTVSTPTVAAPTRKRKRADIHKVTEGYPKSCPDSEECGVHKVFATEHLMKNHRQLHHDDTWPKKTPCNFPGCQLPKDHYFVSKEAFRRHLSNYHFLTAAQAREYIGKIKPVAFRAPRGISKSYIKTRCLFPGCKSKREIANYTDYTSHLKKTHSLTPDQYPKYMPTPDTVRLHSHP